MDNPAQYRARPKHSTPHRHSYAPLFVSITFLLGGCNLFKKPRPAIPWATAVQVHPLLQGFAAGDADLDAPELNFNMPTIAAVFVPATPPRPHVNTHAAPASDAPVAEAEKRPAPTIAPQLSTEESAAAQQETNQSLSIAEKNLAATRNKRLNAAQTDLVSKIRAFLKDAREAAQSGDWARARNLAKKAQVLSEELVRSV